MQNSFYASGFLYSLKNHKILLIHTDQKCSLLGGEGCEGEEAQVAFQRIVSEMLNLELKEKNIHPVYDYFHDGHRKINYVFYGEVKNSREFDSLEEGSYSWVDFREIAKLPFTPSAKQDVIVGERVINAKWREEEGQQVIRHF